MKGFLVTHKGMENIAALEIKEIVHARCEINETCVVFDIKKYEAMFELCYKSQSAINICALLVEFNFGDIFTDFNKNIDKIDFKEWLGKRVSFKVRCEKRTNLDISTPEIEKRFGEIIIDRIQKKHGYKQKVDLGNPDVVVYVYVAGERSYVGIDFMGFDLSKRNYNMFLHPAALKGTMAYFLVRLSGYNRNETLLDCFAGSGIIPIEAAMYASQFPINFYSKEKFAFLNFYRFKKYNFEEFFENIDAKIIDGKTRVVNVDASMKYVNYAKKNSKLAGVDKKINFSRMDVEWLDTKFKKGKVDKIVTKMPLQELDKIYKEFFYQAEFILNKEGKMVVIGNSKMIEQYSAKYKFRISDELSVFSGKEEYRVFLLKLK